MERLTFAEYRARPGLSSSTVATCYRDPRLVGSGADDSEAMRRGRLWHTLILEFEEYPHRYVTLPDCDLRTKEGKTAWLDALAPWGVTATNRDDAAAAMLAQGIEIASVAQREAACRIRDVVLAHPVARDLLTDGVAEGSAFTRLDVGQLDGAPVVVAAKCRPDWYSRSARRVVQLKTTTYRAMQSERLHWTLADRGWDIAEAWCAAVLTASGHPVDDVAWIMVAEDAPIVRVYTAPYQSPLIGAAYECAAAGALRWHEHTTDPERFAAHADRVVSIGALEVRRGGFYE